MASNRDKLARLLLGATASRGASRPRKIRPQRGPRFGGASMMGRTLILRGGKSLGQVTPRRVSHFEVELSALFSLVGYFTVSR